MGNELRVLQYVRVLDNGGIEKLIFSLLENTDRSKVNYDFLLTRNQKEAYEDEIKKYNSKKIVVKGKSKGSIISRYSYSYRSLYKYFCSCPYKIVHFQSVGTSFGGALAILAAKRAGIPVRIVHAHSADSKMNIIRRINVIFGQYLNRKWGTHFMACSDKAAQFSFGKKYKKHCKVEILKNGINIDKFKYDPVIRDEVKKEFDLEGKFVIGAIGRLSPEKNHIFMLEVLKEVVKIRKDAVLLIVGSTSATHEEYEKRIKHLIENSGLNDHVIFAGERNDAYRLYNAFDVYLFPSLWEGLGIVAIEAQANGLPVIASTVVPHEAKLTSNFHYISLKDNATIWANTICQDCNNRVDEHEKIVLAGYDISDSSLRLTNYYLSLYKQSV